MIAVRAPDHLGDAVMALGAITALSRLAPVEVWTRGRWGQELYGDVAARVHAGDGPPAEAAPAVLFKPSWHAAWQWRGLPTVGVGPRGLLGVALPEREEHRRERYARIAMAAGATDVATSSYSSRGNSPPVPPGHVGLNPWSPSPTVRWPRFRALADRLEAEGHAVVVYCGPGEVAEVSAQMGRAAVAGLSLPDFAAALDRCAAFVSNDSGAAHFAAACGRPVVVVHGSTAPALTGTGRAVVGEPLWCQPCYRKTCFWGRPCLDRVSVDAVIAALG
ncbi:MAG: glycosyltransferase family 9 protein [Deltaproteobacteria bacterium]|nr:glycosyltransferase family 9 protein [Deltaproteobacteria bacterium]